MGTADVEHCCMKEACWNLVVIRDCSLKRKPERFGIADIRDMTC